MIRLDHFVLHIDNDIKKLNSLKNQINPMGFPFEPSWGKGTKGFKAANIWVGDQYFELIWLKSKDGGGWRTEWVNKYNNGYRGIIAIFLMTDELDKLRDTLVKRGVAVSVPKRISFRWFFGLFKKILPWRNIFTDAIPGTDLQICFGELDDPDYIKTIRQYMVPNSSDNGINGIKDAIVKCNFTSDAWLYIQRLFPEAEKKENSLVYNMGNTCLSFEQSQNDLSVELNAISATLNYKGNSFEIENTKVVI